MHHEICPLCHGVGTVDVGFYPDGKAGEREKCRACNGRGVILAPGYGRVVFIPGIATPYTCPPVPYTTWCDSHTSP